MLLLETKERPLKNICRIRIHREEDMGRPSRPGLEEPKGSNPGGPWTRRSATSSGGKKEAHSREKMKGGKGHTLCLR